MNPQQGQIQLCRRAAPPVNDHRSLEGVLCILARQLAAIVKKHSVSDLESVGQAVF